MRAHRKRWRGVAGAVALATGTVAAAPVGAEASPSPAAAVVINEVYGGGGNSGPTFRHDFVELANTSAAPVDLTGWSVQYASSSGTSWAVTPLVGTLPAGSTYVVRQAQGASGTVDVVGDVNGSVSMSGTAGKLALANSTIALPNTCTGKSGGSPCSDLGQVVDFVGYGSGANDFAGTGPTPAPSNTASVSRNAAHANTADNAADFTVSSPPTPSPCGQACVPAAPGPEVKSIAEVQGPGATSPEAGNEVRVRGVVTAAYPTGGFRGFYLQTEGTGPEASGTGASDGIFVFQGSGALDADAVIGNHVEVTGTVSERFGLTEISAAASDIVDAGEDFSPVQALVTPWPTSEAGREAIEGMLFQPTGDYTVTNTFSTNRFGEVGLAVGTTPLLQTTEVAAPGSPEQLSVAADNLARAVTLDDGASTNFTAQSFSTRTCGVRPIPCLLNGDVTPPYVSTTEPVRNGAAATFSEPVVVDWRFDLWRFQPTSPVIGPDNEASPVTFEDTRTSTPDEAALNRLGSADLKVSSFNVLNYFTTLGAQTEGCLAWYDRDDNGTTVREGCDLRGAWDAQDLQRQQDKIVSAINSLDADVVGLMEVENSARLGESRDEALAALVAALNAKAGPGTWAFVPSSAELPAVGLQDFITNAIIYKPATVMRVDQSRALGTASQEGQAFANAREPIAQVFKAKNAKAEKFLFVVNHFKSKGSQGPFPGDEDTGDGQGASVTSRILQAQALRDWIPTVLDETSTKAVITVGDYNSYTMEDPMDVLHRAGYTDVGQRFDEGRYSYSFSANEDFGLNGLGLSGSLDHILVNDAALRLATGATHWNINAGESLALEYSRYNYHGTDFHSPGPYRSSDHDPVVLGLRASVK